MKKQFINKDKLTKWLLGLTLVFSIFTFSVNLAPSQSNSFETIQTERVVSNNSKICKRTISFNKASEIVPFISSLNCSDKIWKNALFTYNLLTKVKLDAISWQFYSNKTAKYFLQEKTIPQSSDEDIFETSVG